MSPTKRRHKMVSDTETIQMMSEIGDDHEHMQFGPMPYGSEAVFDPNSASAIIDSLDYFDTNNFWMRYEKHNFKDPYKI